MQMTLKTTMLMNYGFLGGSLGVLEGAWKRKDACWKLLDACWRALGCMLDRWIPIDGVDTAVVGRARRERRRVSKMRRETARGADEWEGE